jgi:predicted DNA-binding transcriptional regulator AlpA
MKPSNKAKKRAARKRALPVAANKKPPIDAAALKASTAPCALSPALVEANNAFQAERALAGDAPVAHQRDEHVHQARGPPVRLLNKHEVLVISGASFPTIWTWMREGRFPRSRIVGGRSMWLSTDIEMWLATLPIRPLKGDANRVAASAS